MMRSTFMTALAFIVVSACGYRSLPQLTTDSGNVGRDDSATDCTVSGSCANGVCDPESRMCVACLDDSTCGGVTPICGDHACRACTSNSECTVSNTCLPTGACADLSEVAYVDAQGSGTTCTLGAPCTTLAAAFALERSYVHLSGAVSEAVSLNSTRTIIGERDASGAITSKIAGTSATSDVISVSTTADLTLVDIAIVGPGNNGISLGDGKISIFRSSISGMTNVGLAAFAGTVVVDRSLIGSNQRGGFDLENCAFHVMNTFVIGNGGTNSMIGGILLYRSSGGIDFTTVANNIGVNDGSSKGIWCIQVSTATVSNTIVYNNTGAQTTGPCTFAYSDTFPGNALAGEHNLAFNPMVDAAFHLSPTSPLVDEADPTSVIAFDWDGDPRPQGPTRDIGADERIP